MSYSIEIPFVDDIAIITQKHGAFKGLIDPKDYAKRRLLSFTREQIKESLPDFRVVKQDEQIVAGIYMHPGGWLQDFFIDKGHEDAFNLLIKEISSYQDKYFVSFRSIPPTVQEILIPIFEKNGYQLTYDHDLHLNLIDFPEYMDINFIPQSWWNDLDAKFQKTYEKYHHDPWPWDMLKHQTGGGLFTSELWFIHPEELGIIGINRPKKESVSVNKAFNIVVLLGESDVKMGLAEYAIWHCAKIDPTGIVNTHALDKDLRFYQHIGFEIKESHQQYFPLDHKMLL